jgi:D-glucuronyl C5-epimerase-like protein
MGRALAAAVLVVLVGAGHAHAALPSVTISATAIQGEAPLVVTFTAHGDAASYHWELGNGKTAEGPVASATYGPGWWTASVIATAADGTTAQASIDLRSVTIRLRRAQGSRYGEPALFRGSVVPALPGESIGLYAQGGWIAGARAEPDGTFQTRVPRLRTPGPYEARTRLAASMPVFLKVHPVLQMSLVGVSGIGARLVAHVLPTTAGRLDARVYCADELVRGMRGVGEADFAVSADCSAGYRAVVQLLPAQGWFTTSQTAHATMVSASRALGVLDASDRSVVFEHYAGVGYRFQPLLSFAKLNQSVSQRRPYAARRIAAALLGRAVRRGDALYWEYDFPYQGNPAPWTSGFAQAVAAQGLARAGALLREPLLGAAAVAAFRGLRRTLLMPIAGGLWIQEYGFTHRVILNAQLQSIISLASYAKTAESAAADRVVRELIVATRRLLPLFDLGCWARYELAGPAASVSYQRYHVDLLRRLAAKRPEPIWRETYARWRRCLP